MIFLFYFDPKIVLLSFSFLLFHSAGGGEWASLCCISSAELIHDSILKRRCKSLKQECLGVRDHSDISLVSPNTFLASLEYDLKTSKSESKQQYRHKTLGLKSHTQGLKNHLHDLSKTLKNFPVQKLTKLNYWHTKLQKDMKILAIYSQVSVVFFVGFAVFH